jgi:hypothetical protein
MDYLTNRRRTGASTGEKAVMSGGFLIHKGAKGVASGVTQNLLNEAAIDRAVNALGKKAGLKYDAAAAVKKIGQDRGLETVGEYVKLAGELFGGIKSAQVVAAGISGLKPIAKANDLIKMAAVRGLTGAATAGWRNMIAYARGDQSLSNALKNTGVTVGATMFGMIPEQKVREGMLNFIAQVGGDVAKYHPHLLR